MQHRIRMTQHAGLAICGRCRQVDPLEYLQLTSCQADPDEQDFFRLADVHQESVAAMAFMGFLFITLVVAFLVMVGP